MEAVFVFGEWRYTHNWYTVHGARCMQSNVFGRTLYNHAITNHRAAYNTRMIFFYGVMISYICNNRLAKLQKKKKTWDLSSQDLDYRYRMYAYRNYLVEALALHPFGCANVKCKASTRTVCVFWLFRIFGFVITTRAFNVFSFGHKSFVSHNHISQIPSRVRFNFYLLARLSRARKKN